MSDLPEIKNEPTVEMPRDELRRIRARNSTCSRPARPQDDEPRKSRFKFLPALLAILLAIVGGWHWFAANHLEKQLTRHFGNRSLRKYAGHHRGGGRSSIDQSGRDSDHAQVARKEAAFDFLADAIIEYVRQELEPKMERELSIAARRDVDLYAMMVPYKCRSR